MKKNLKKKKGFTLVELIIVIAVLGILAAIAVPRFGNVSKNAKKSADIASAKMIADTTIRLIAEDKIKLPSDGKGYGVWLNEGENGKIIANEFNKIPAVQQYSNAKFFINVYKNGSILVSAVDTEKNKVIEDLYPQK